MNNSITVRQATNKDLETIAMVVEEAIGSTESLVEYCGTDYHNVLLNIANTNGTQYNWSNTLIAEYNGEIAGGVIGYDGALLQSLRANTLSVVKEHTGNTPNIPDETQPGEYYLDSIAVYPHLRGKGIGKELIRQLCKYAFSNGHKRVGLICDYNNPKAEKLYTSVGFKQIGNKLFFGHRMKHLINEQ